MHMSTYIIIKMSENATNQEIRVIDEIRHV